ncbi:MAG: dihydrofolate reductase [Deltaproteobacteria bacterium]|nr:dihydrofolate reductase [Deltaproteobacteria bacterium]
MSAKKQLGLVAAIARGGVIGQEGGHLGLPWHIPEDLAHFKRLTTGHAIVMGRTTYETIGRPLPKRVNVVLSRDPEFAPTPPKGDLRIARGLEEALEVAYGADAEAPPMIIGGATIYALALPLVTHLHLTEIDREVEGDAHFPAFDRESFEEVERRAAETPDVTFVTLVRRGFVSGP